MENKNGFKITAIDMADAPFTAAARHGRWSDLFKQLSTIGEGKMLRLEPCLTKADIASLRASAHQKSVSLSLRSTPEATFVWKKEAK